MNLTTKIALGAGAAIASAALVVTPAMAAAYVWDTDIVVNGFTYETEDATPAADEIAFGDYSDTIDGQNFQITIDDFADSESIDCANPQLNDAADASGDKILSCDAYDALGLTLKPELRIYASGQLSRMSIDITNETSAPIGFQWQYYIGIGDSDVVWNAEHPAGTQSVDPAVDNWATAWGDGTDGAPVSYMWGGPNGGDRATDWETGDSDEGYFWTDTKFELAPTQVVTYAFFTFVQTSAEATDVTRKALWESTTPLFGGPGGDIVLLSVPAADPDYDTLLVGLDNCVANFDLCTTPAPALPDTGVSENAGIWAASAALIAGLGIAAVFMARRRKA